MRHSAICFIFTLFLLLTGNLLSAQTGPAIRWQKCLGGSAEDKALDVLINPDGSYIVVGSTFSNDGDVSGNHGGGDAWIVKLDTTGNIVWQRPVGGTGNDYFNTVIATNDNAYLCVGYTNSNDGDVSGNHGAGDAWVVKINANGTVLWSKCYGGTKYDIASDALLADDGGYAIMATSNSYDGDVQSGLQGRTDSDGWAFKLNAAGDIQWEKCLNTDFNFIKASHIPNDVGYNIIKSEDDNYYALISSSEDYEGGIFPYYDTLIRTPGKLYKLAKNNGSSTLMATLGGDYNFAMSKSANGILSSFVEKTYFYVEYCFDESLYTAYKTDGSNAFTNQLQEGPAQCTFSALKTRLAATHGIMALPATNSFVAVGEKEKNYQFGTGTSAYLNIAGTKKTYGGNPNGWGNFTKEAFSSVKVFPGGDEYIVVGNTNSTDGDVSGYHGSNGGGPQDCWVLRLEALNRITGNVFIDANGNGNFDAGESAFNHAIIKSSRAGFEQSAIPFQGNYNNSVDLGSFTTNITLTRPYYTATPTSANTVFTSYKNIATINFAVQPIPGIIDYAVYASSLLTPRPGFPLQYNVIYKNKGTTTLTNKEVVFIKDSRSHYTSSIPPFTSMSGDSIKWAITSLLPEGTGNILLNLELDPIPLVNINDTLEAAVYIDSTLDIYRADNYVSIRQPITGSFDPNDKQEIHGGFITPEEISAGKYLDYTIRFQNTGNDTAFNIIIRDTLDTKLDWDSIEIISSSHPYQVNIKNKQFVTFRFSLIKLVDSVQNEPLSHGYISYRIKPKSSVLLGDTIRNSASIYFDFNPAIITNTQLSIIRNRPVQVTWTGTNSTAWEDPQNWSNGKVPDANTDVTINNGLTNYPIVQSNAACRSLHVKPGSTITLKTGFAITVVH